MQQKYKSLLISRTRKAKMDASEKKKSLNLLEGQKFCLHQILNFTL